MSGHSIQDASGGAEKIRLNSVDGHFQGNLLKVKGLDAFPDLL